jgi:trans-aconitate methyltransferase
MASSLEELEQELRSISHGEEAIQAVQAFSDTLSGTKARLDVWNAINERRTVPSSRGTGCSPSSLYAFLVLQNNSVG